MNEIIDGEQLHKKQRKLESKQLHSTSNEVELIFDENFPIQNIKLFEVTPEIASKVLVGESLKIVGAEKGDAVLCTKNMTYTIKKVETSNTGIHNITIHFLSYLTQ